MNWLLWRQHRTQALVTGVALALFALVVVVTGVHMAHLYDDTVRNCPSNGACDLLGNLFKGDGAIIDTVHLTIALPILLGLFVGATLVARETEHATNVLVWTQTVTRRRWLFTKVGMALVATLLTSAAVSALVTWWSGTPNALDGNRFQGAQFDTQNVAPIAFALFAVALGIAAGCLIRRTLPALAATVGIFTVLRIVVSVYLRPHYTKAVTKTFGVGLDGQLPSGSWTLSSHLVDPTGNVVNGLLHMPAACSSAVDRSGVQGCLDRVGFHTVVSYHPASHYWPFQWIEAGIYIVLAIGLVIFALAHTLRRDA
jgi:ABC-type transport system involved in multi-copper enzyme maturation permease subunit